MNALEVKGLCKRYPAFSLENVSFSVPEGAVMGFIGRNGAGKSTTLKSILGLVHPDAGEVTVLGKSFREEEQSIKERIGVVLGGIDFYPKKKVRLLSDVTRRFYGNWQEEKYRHYLNLFGIDQEKRVDQLSTGMRVKYMIALALSHDARLLILDEPHEQAVGLDGIPLPDGQQGGVVHVFLLPTVKEGEEQPQHHIEPHDGIGVGRDQQHDSEQAEHQRHRLAHQPQLLIQ